MKALALPAWRDWGIRLLDGIYPRHCCACGTEIRERLETGLCWDCRSGTAAISPPCCERCGMAVAGRIDHAFTCADCAAEPPAFTRARSLFRYEGGVRDAIHALKYHRDFSVVPDLSRLLLAGWRTYYPEEDLRVFAAVPLHPRRLRERRFNQGEELLRGLRRLAPEIEIWRGLRRVKHTDTQTRLSKAGRRENVRGAFRVRPGAAVPEKLVLVDDVMTTGATLDACARALRRAGVREIHALTLARG